MPLPRPMTRVHSSSSSSGERAVVPLLVLAAEGDVEADGEPGEEGGAVRVAEVDDLVELEPEGLDQLQRLAEVGAALLEV
jgi:hypothetical protein